MFVDLSKYAHKKICVAVSGGRDSMALLHYLYVHGGEYGVALSALNCDHGLRGEASARDSAFVREWCAARRIPLLFFKSAKGAFKSEADARSWRVFGCYATASRPSALWEESEERPEIFSDDGVWQGADAVATAHHLNDNAETVLFHLARGSALSGACGIYDRTDGCGWCEIHPLIGCSREDIDGYIAENGIRFVEDESNFSDDFTRNKIRHNVLPELEKAVPGAAEAIFRFSRLAAEDEEYFARQTEKLIVGAPPCGYGVLFCAERALFKRAVVSIVADRYKRKDYTSEQAERLYRLQFAENGKIFRFLGLTAFKEEGKVTVVPDDALQRQGEEIPFGIYLGQSEKDYCGQPFAVVGRSNEDNARRLAPRGGEQAVAADERPERFKALKFDAKAIPSNAVVRFMRAGDRFTKFGGGTKKLGDYFTDKKIPVRLRGTIPLIASGNRVLAVGGVEISEDIKVTEQTEEVLYLVCADYAENKTP